MKGASVRRLGPMAATITRRRAFAFLALLVLTAPPVYAQRRDWTTTNKVAAVAVGLAIAGDHLTTVDLVRRLNDGHREGGLGRIFLGSRPKLAAVHRLFLAGSVLTFLIADRLPSDARNVWLGLVAGGELVALLSNHANGLRFSLRF